MEGDFLVEIPASVSTTRLVNSPVDSTNFFQQQPRREEVVALIETLETTEDSTLDSKIKFDNLVSPTATENNSLNSKPIGVVLFERQNNQRQARLQSTESDQNPQPNKTRSFFHEDESKDTKLNDVSIISLHKIDRVITNSKMNNPTSTLASTRSFNDFARTSSMRDEDASSTSMISDEITIDCSEFNSSNSSRASLSLEEAKHITIKEAKVVYDLQCQLCKGNYRHPKVLPCLHSFCHSCLEDTINEVERSFNCPVCHLVIPIPTKGVEAFPLNSFTCNILNILAVENPHNCTNCEDRELASARCLDCVENLCMNCVTAHERIRQTKTHRIVSFEELQNNTVDESIRCPSFCKIHDREILKYFCESCDAAICRDCAIFEHREHNYLDLKEAVKSHGKQLEALLSNTKQKVPILKDALESILNVENSLHKRRKQIEDSINQSVNAHINLLEEKRQSLLTQTKHMAQVKNNVLEQQLKRLHFDLDNVVSSCEFVNNVITFGNEAEFMDVKHFMLSRIHQLDEYKSQLVPEENDIMTFESSNQALLDGTKKFGILSTSQAFAPKCVGSEKNETTVKIGYLSSFQIILNDRHGQPINHGGDDVKAVMNNAEGDHLAVEVIDNRNGTYTIKYKVTSKTDHFLGVTLGGQPISESPFVIDVSTGVDTMRIGPVLTWFSSSGVEAHMTVNDTFEPWGICCNGKDDIIVTDHNNHKVLTFDQNGKLLRQFGSRGKNDGEIWYPTGVAVDNNNNIFVADHGNHRIQVFSSEGKFLRKIGSRGNMDGLLKGPCDVAIDLKNRLIVADRDNHRIQVLSTSSDGKFLFNIGSYGNTEGKFDSPRHVTVTNDNHIIVSDSNNGRVQRFDEHGQYVGSLGSGRKGSNAAQFQCPSGLSTDTEDNLVVGDFKRLVVQIFDKEGLLLKSIGGENVLSKPTGLCVTSSGNVLVADRGAHKIFLF